MSRRETLIATSCIFLSICLFAGMALIIDAVYHPDLSGAMRTANELSILPSFQFRPEPKEKLLFYAGVFCIPLFLLLFHFPVSKAVQNLSDQVADRLHAPLVLLSTAAVTCLGYAGLAAQNPFFIDKKNAQDAVAATNLQFYLLHTFLYDHFLLYALLLFPLLAFLFWYFCLRSTTTSVSIGRLGNPAMYVWCGLLTVVTIIINTFYFPYTTENKYDFSAVFSSMVQVYHGIPMLVDHFNNTYGLYPHFVLPLFKVVGLSILSFSGVMALLIGFCYLLLLAYLRRELSSPLLVAACFSSIFFYSNFYFKIATSFDAIFVAQPIRLLFPTLALFLSSLFRGRPSLVSSIGTYLLFSVGILWNPESGLPTFLAWMLFLIYTEIMSGEEGKAVRCTRQAALALGTAAVTVTAYAVFIRALYGAFPDMGSLLRTMKMFSQIGVGLLPMPLLHPWNIIALACVAGMAGSLYPLLTRTGTMRHGRLLLVTLLCISSLAYYQGRSHNWSLMPCFIYFFILLGFYADNLLREVRTRMILYIPLVLVSFILCSSILQVAYAYHDISRLLTQKEDKLANASEQQMLLQNGAFIKGNVKKGDRILILAQDYYQGLYYGLSDTAAAFNPSLIDLLWRSDYDRLLQFLITNRTTPVFYQPEAFSYVDMRIPLILQDLYVVKRSNGSMMMLGRKDAGP